MPEMDWPREGTKITKGNGFDEQRTGFTQLRSRQGQLRTARHEGEVGLSLFKGDFVGWGFPGLPRRWRGVGGGAGRRNQNVKERVRWPISPERAIDKSGWIEWSGSVASGSFPG